MDMKIHQAGSDPLFKVDNKISAEEHHAAAPVMERRFNPYVMNEGTIAGKFPNLILSCGRKGFLRDHRRYKMLNGVFHSFKRCFKDHSTDIQVCHCNCWNESRYACSS